MTRMRPGLSRRRVRRRPEGMRALVRWGRRGPGLTGRILTPRPLSKRSLSPPSRCPIFPAWGGHAMDLRVFPRVGPVREDIRAQIAARSAHGLAGAQRQRCERERAPFRKPPGAAHWIKQALVEALRATFPRHGIPQRPLAAIHLSGSRQAKSGAMETARTCVLYRKR